MSDVICDAEAETRHHFNNFTQSQSVIPVLGFSVEALVTLDSDPLRSS